jgi:putative hydrolase of the HAD superfamily
MLAGVSVAPVVLLDVGGVLQLPEPTLVRRALAPLGVVVDAARVDEAHYRAAAACRDLPEATGVGERFGPAYVRALGVPADLEANAMEVLSELFEDPDVIWRGIAPGAREGLAACAAGGVRIGIVSNADGLVAQRLRAASLVQVGEGPGQPVEVIIDSAIVGIAKPDPRIFDIALAAMDIPAAGSFYVGDIAPIDVAGAIAAGLTPILLDPLGLQGPSSWHRVATLTDAVSIVTARATP